MLCLLFLFRFSKCASSAQLFLVLFFAFCRKQQLQVDWEVLEPSSAVLQTTAIPSQLPVLFLLCEDPTVFFNPKIKTRKNPVSLEATPGFPI